MELSAPPAPAAGLSDVALLVEHRTTVDAHATIEAVSDFMYRLEYEYAAVVDDGRVIGVCGKDDIHERLSGRYGFALFSRAIVRDHLKRDALVLPATIDLRHLLHVALGRTGEAFYDDVAVVDAGGGLVGLISTQRLVRAQSELMKAQFDLVDEQREQLARANGDLARGLAHQQELERQIIAKEKADLVEGLASGIAHELNNKLVPILAYSELLLDEVASVDDGALQESCRTIHAAALDSSRIIRQLLQLSRPSTTERVQCDLREVIEQSLSLLALRLREHNIPTVRELPSEPVMAVVDGGQIRQVLTNLILNAMDAMETAVYRELRIGLRTIDGRAQLSVSDSGAGVPAEIASKIFDPFFTTKAPNRGTGLGLSVSLSIVRAHGGDITVQSSAGGPTVFTAVVPCEAPQPAHVPAVRPESKPSNRNNAVVLVVDDDDAVAGAVSRILERKLGCLVRRAANGDAACAMLAARDYDLILSDVRMPGLNGVDLLRWIQRHRAHLVRRLVFMTGDASPSTLNTAIGEADVPVLRKPVTVDGLATLALAVLESGDVAL
jgi:two-component system NtrC family sensor kinase